MRLYTLKDFSEAIRQAEGRPSIDRVHNQLRGVAARGLLAPVPDRYGPRGALLFDLDQIYDARLLIALIETGLESDSLASVIASARIGRTTIEAGKLNLSAVIKSLQDEAPAVWKLEVVGSRERGDEGDTLGYFPQWVRDGNRFGYADPHSEDAFVIGRTIECVLTVNVSRIFAPLHKVMHGAK